MLEIALRGSLYTLCAIFVFSSLFFLLTLGGQRRLLDRAGRRIRASLIGDLSVLLLGHLALIAVLDGHVSDVFGACTVVTLGACGLVCDVRRYRRWRAVALRRRNRPRSA